MKRSILILLSSALILLAACRAEPQELKDTFDAEAAVSGGEIGYTAHVSRSPETVTAEFLSPASVAGLTYTYDGEELTASYGDLSCITSFDSLPPSSVPAMLCEALYNLDEAVYESSSDGTDTYRLLMSAGDAVMTCEGGLPQTISSAGSPYTCTFSQHQ